MARMELDSIPKNIFAWSDVFNDDLGFEPSSSGASTDEKPGSPEKIAIINERLARGQAIWHPDDAKDENYVDGETSRDAAFSVDVYSVAGNLDFGAVVGRDVAGGKHRYAIWTNPQVKSKLRAKPKPPIKPLKLLYVTEGCGYTDSFDLDPELAAIRTHARVQGATFVAVVPLFSVRARNQRELQAAEYPITGVSLLWSRWLARYCDKVIACWGDTTRLERNVDMLWMLSRTSKGGAVYAPTEFSAHPERVVVSKGIGLHRFDYKQLIATREEEEHDEDLGDRSRDD